MNNEMESLNVDDLSVEGLEQRLELAAAAPSLASDCTVKISGCENLCGGNISWSCGG